MLGKTEGRRRGPQKMRWLDSNTNPTDTNLSTPRDIVKDGEAWRAAVQRARHDSVTEQQPPKVTESVAASTCSLGDSLTLCASSKDE